MTQKIGAIQVLRAIAANLVVAGHVIGLQGRLHPELQRFSDLASDLGAIGVHCFFAISGFVITRAAMREDWRSFAMSRVLRIYPIYWFYLVLSVAFVVLWQHEAVSGSRLVASFFLLPFETQIVPVAWSLVYEVYFYAIIAGAIAIGAGLRRVYIGWTISIVILNAVAPQSFFWSWMMLEFIAGGFVGLMRPHHVDRTLAVIPAPRWLQVLGDASYSIYLCHFLVIAALGKVLFFIAPAYSIPSMLLCFAASNVVGVASYVWLERPLLSRAGRLRAMLRPAVHHPARA